MNGCSLHFLPTYEHKQLEGRTFLDQTISAIYDTQLQYVSRYNSKVCVLIRAEPVRARFSRKVATRDHFTERRLRLVPRLSTKPCSSLIRVPGNFSASCFLCVGVFFGLIVMIALYLSTGIGRLYVTGISVSLDSMQCKSTDLQDRSLDHFDHRKNNYYTKSKICPVR